MMATSVVPLEQGLKQILLGGTEAARATRPPAPVRAVQVVMDKKRPRLAMQSVVALGESVQADVEQLVDLLEEDEPCFLMVMLSPEEAKWALISWVPPAVSEQRKAVLLRNAEGIEQELGHNVIAKKVAGEKREVQQFLMLTSSSQRNSVSRSSLRNADRVSLGQTAQDVSGHAYLQEEVIALREGLEALRSECSDLRKRLDHELNGRIPHEKLQDGFPLASVDTMGPLHADVAELKTTVMQEKHSHSLMRVEFDDLLERVNEDSETLKFLRGDFEALVSILGEEEDESAKVEAQPSAAPQQPVQSRLTFRSIGRGPSIVIPRPYGMMSQFRADLNGLKQIVEGIRGATRPTTIIEDDEEEEEQFRSSSQH